MNFFGVEKLSAVFFSTLAVVFSAAYCGFKVVALLGLLFTGEAGVAWNDCCTDPMPASLWRFPRVFPFRTSQEPRSARDSSLARTAAAPRSRRKHCREQPSCCLPEVRITLELDSVVRS
jgi:hypothetical protein